MSSLPEKIPDEPGFVRSLLKTLWMLLFCYSATFVLAGLWFREWGTPFWMWLAVVVGLLSIQVLLMWWHKTSSEDDDE